MNGGGFFTVKRSICSFGHSSLELHIHRYKFCVFPFKPMFCPFGFIVFLDDSWNIKRCAIVNLQVVEFSCQSHLIWGLLDHICCSWFTFLIFLCNFCDPPTSHWSWTICSSVSLQDPNLDIPLSLSPGQACMFLPLCLFSQWFSRIGWLLCLLKLYPALKMLVKYHFFQVSLRVHISWRKLGKPTHLTLISL